MAWRLKEKQSVSGFREKKELDFAVIVTAYEQTDLIPQAVASIRALNYRNYLVYVVADNCAENEDLVFDDSLVNVLYPPTTLASNVASHFYAINHFVREHDALVIIDSDNLVDPDLLKQLNSRFFEGFSAVQGIRLPKTLDSEIACLDAARDIYYHFYDGKLLFNVGSSATLSGSGMAFTVQLYKECLENRDLKGAGFDKVLQAEIVRRGKRIAFADSAVVFDQKTSNSTQLVSQRSRWIMTWFRYFSLGFKLMYYGMLKMDLNRMLFGSVLLRPPLFMFLGMALLLLVAGLFLDTGLSVLMGIGLAVFVLSFLLSLHYSNTDKKIYKSLAYIPVFVFYQVISLLSFKFRKGNVATRHEIEK
ncbi:glycosyltransferase [Pedobacter deserti]|uniref:glycosyltransferase n=1 Tax=Pedobacter deserti TaxID=2817382 RepID=UPI00210B3880|nr:glycosyltransferase [Pedobacter sp. SYSU D00382]